MAADFGKSADDYAKYRDRMPDVLFDQFDRCGLRFDGQTVIDLGAGTGIFCRDLALRGANVIGIEPSASMIDAARRSDERTRGSVRYIRAQAEHFTWPDHVAFVTALRAWHWFDRSKVLRNVKRVLQADGRLIVIHAIFLPDSDIAKATFDVLTRHRVELKPPGAFAEARERRNGFPVNWYDEWAEHGFALQHEWQHTYSIPFTQEGWCGKMRSVSWLANASEERKAEVTAALQERIRSFPAIIEVPHRYSVVVLSNVK